MAKQPDVRLTLLTNLRAALTAIRDVDLVDILNVKNAGRVDAKTFQTLGNTLTLFRDISVADLDRFPDFALETINGPTTQLKLFLDSLQKELTQKDMASYRTKRTQILNQITGSYSRWFTELRPNIGIFPQTEEKLRTLENTTLDLLDNTRHEADAIIQKTNKQIDEIKTETEKVKEETTTLLETTLVKVEGTLELARQQLTEIVLAGHSYHFSTEADIHKKSANGWLIATIVMYSLLGIVSVGALLFYAFGPNIPSNMIIQVSVAKILLVSLLYYIVVWSGRNLKAHKHNYIVNKHRQNALNSYKAIAAATADSEIRNNLLVKVADAIYSPDTTGFVTKEQSSADLKAIASLVPKLLSKS